MKPTDDILQAIRQLHVAASAELDERVHGAITTAAARPATAPPSAPDLKVWQIIRVVVKSRSTRYTLATTLGLALLAVLVLNRSTTSAWAMEQAIEALQKYKGLHIMGYTATGSGPAPLEVWARANASGTRSDACLAKLGDVTVWVKDNKTYAYEPARNTVFVEPGVTAGLNPWFSPRFLTTLARMNDYQAHEGTDAATGQKRVFVTASLGSTLGPQSFLIEFDARSKLPVSMKCWPS